MQCLYPVRVMAALMALGFSACSDPDAPELVSCPAKVTMSVTLIDTTPRFDWTPRCGVSALEASSGPSVVLQYSEWRLEADGAVIVPPVTLGVVPPGVRSSGFLPLLPRVQYRVDIFIRDRPRPGDWVGNSGWRQP